MAGGAVLFAAGIAALIQLLANPAELTAVSGIAALFGATPATAILGVLTAIGTGLSLILHGAVSIMSRAGMLSSTAASALTGLETVVDGVTTWLALATTASTVEGLTATLGALVPLAFAVYNSTNAVVQDIQDEQNVNDITQSGCHTSCMVR